jgi:hypothetical protein
VGVSECLSVSGVAPCAPQHALNSLHHIVAPQGFVSALACDPSHSTWLMTGSSRGHMAVFDTRFQVCV